MKLFIKIQDGKPFEHPIMDENMRDAFPHIDQNNLPDTFAEFVRVAPPNIDRFEVYEGVTYEKVGNIYTDVHHVRPMTEEEKVAAKADRDAKKQVEEQKKKDEEVKKQEELNQQEEFKEKANASEIKEEKPAMPGGGMPGGMGGMDY